MPEVIERIFIFFNIAMHEIFEIECPKNATPGPPFFENFGLIMYLYIYSSKYRELRMTQTQMVAKKTALENQYYAQGNYK